jgi:hypothetical protein
MIWFYGDDPPLGSTYLGRFQRVPPNMRPDIDESPTNRNVLLQCMPRLGFLLAAHEDRVAYQIVRVEQHGDAWFNVDPDGNKWFENRHQTAGQLRASRIGPMRMPRPEEKEKSLRPQGRPHHEDGTGSKQTQQHEDTYSQPFVLHKRTLPQISDFSTPVRDTYDQIRHPPHALKPLLSASQPPNPQIIFNCFPLFCPEKPRILHRERILKVYC